MKTANSLRRKQHKVFWSQVLLVWCHSNTIELLIQCLCLRDPPPITIQPGEETLDGTRTKQCIHSCVNLSKHPQLWVAF